MCYLQNHDKAPTQNLVAAPVAMIAAAMGVESFMITFKAIVLEDSTNISTMCAMKGEKSQTIMANVNNLK